MPITAMARLTRHQREQAILRLHAGQSVELPTRVLNCRPECWTAGQSVELLANVYNVHISRLPSCTQKQRYQQYQRPPGTGWLRVTARHWLASCHRPSHDRCAVGVRLRSPLTRATETPRALTETTSTRRADTARRLRQSLTSTNLFWQSVIARTIAGNEKCPPQRIDPNIRRTVSERPTTEVQFISHEQFTNVLFSDESRFCISTSDGRVRVWRRGEC